MHALRNLRDKGERRKRKMAGVASVAESSPIFEIGSYTPKSITVETSGDASVSSPPPKPLLIFSPAEQGTYPVLLFFHGFYMLNTFYTDLLRFISSHGLIVVAPQMYLNMCTSQTEEVDDAGKLTNWLNPGLKSTLPDDVVPDFLKLVVSGHSRGGKTAFALALGYANTPLDLNFKALIGVDPVAGCNKMCRTRPHVLTYEPRSFNLSIPVTVIGTGLGSEWRNCVSPPCAADGVNHKEFFNECKPPCAHFATTNYGHMDMLDDHLKGIKGLLSNCACKNGVGPREPMRRCIGGIIVAFVKAFLDGDQAEFRGIVGKTIEAPVDLSDVDFIET